MVEALVETSVEATVEAPIEVAVEASEANQAGEPSLAANVVQAPKLSELSKPAGVSQAVEAAAADYAQVVESAPINFVQAEESWLIKFFKARKSALINLFQGEEPAEANLAQVEEAPIVNFHHVGRPALAARANQAEESRDPPQTPAPSTQTTAPENPLAASVKEAEESQNPPQTPAPSKQAAAPEGPLSGFAGCAPTGQGYGTITALRGEFLPPDRYAVFLSINGHWGNLYHDESLNGAPKSFHTLFGGDYKALVKSAREIQGPVSITTLSIRKGLLKVTMDFLDRQTPASVSVATLCRGDELALIHTFHNKTASK